MYVFLATMGERPEAITVALERLRMRYVYDEVAILHTSRTASRIGEALHALEAVLQAQDIPLRCHELCLPDGGPLIDITDAISADAYYRVVLDTLSSYRERGYHQHLLVSGGRKAMSIYATLAAGVVFNRPHDRVWTVLSPPRMLQSGQWHIPPGELDNVHVVDMPLVTARLAPGADPRHYAEQSRQDDRAAFLAKLTERQRELVETLRSHPDATNGDLAALLHKSEKTVENQFVAVYNKMIGFFDLGETIRHKRETLLSLLREE